MHDLLTCTGKATVEGYERYSYVDIHLEVDHWRPLCVSLRPVGAASQVFNRIRSVGPYFTFKIPLIDYLLQATDQQLRSMEGFRISLSDSPLGDISMNSDRMAADDGERERLIQTLDIILRIEDSTYRVEFSGTAGPVDPSTTIEDLELEKIPVQFHVCCHIREESIPLVFRKSDFQAQLAQKLR